MCRRSGCVGFRCHGGWRILLGSWLGSWGCDGGCDRGRDRGDLPYVEVSQKGRGVGGCGGLAGFEENSIERARGSFGVVKICCVGGGEEGNEEEWE